MRLVGLIRNRPTAVFKFCHAYKALYPTPRFHMTNLLLIPSDQSDLTNEMHNYELQDCIAIGCHASLCMRECIVPQTSVH